MLIVAGGLTQAFPSHGAVAGHTGLMVIENGAEDTVPPGPFAVSVHVVTSCMLLSVVPVLVAPLAGVKLIAWNLVAPFPEQLTEIDVAFVADQERA